MNNFSQWNSNMLYFNHVDRLVKIKDRKIKPSISQEERKCFTSLRMPSKNSNNSHHLPLPLVPARQRKLLHSALSIADISLHQKQLLLENYLLGRRIITTEPVLSNKSLKRQFKIHKRVSKNMSKSLKSQDILNKDRQFKFDTFRNTLEFEAYGRGNYFIEIGISSLILLKTKIDNSSQNLIKISLKLGHRNYSHKALTYQEFMKEKFRFSFQKKDIRRKEFLQLHLDILRKNQLTKIGHFNVELKNFLEDQVIQNEGRIENIFNNNDNVVGSIKYCLTAKKLLF